MLSSTIGTVMSFVVSPGAKCAGALDAVKSAGDAADPGAVDQGTWMAPELGFVSEIVNVATPAASSTVLSLTEATGVGSSSLIVTNTEPPGPSQLTSAANVSSGSSMLSLTIGTR